MLSNKTYNRIFVTGDKHGSAVELRQMVNEQNLTKEDAVILLGDLGANYYLDKRDRRFKQELCELGPILYVVRGNHEARPNEIETMQYDYDDAVDQYVYFEEAYPHIRYLLDGCVYNFNGYTALVLGGAYSVDKYYRLQRGWHWFEHEQLTEHEMANIKDLVEHFDGEFDFILSHTCPISWEPTDLFLSVIDQSTVDKSMEKWLEEIKDIAHWRVWLFGHYHNDRLVRPGVEMYFHYYEDLNVIYNRWTTDSNEQIRWLRKDPNFYMK